MLLNEAVKIERSEFIGAQPRERTAERECHANGFKPKCLSTRLGKRDLQIPRLEEKKAFILQLLSKDNAANGL